MDKTTYGQSKVMGFDPKVINLVLSYSVVTSHAFTSLWCFFTFTVRILSCTAFSCFVRCLFEVDQYSHCSQGYLHVQHHMFRHFIVPLIVCMCPNEVFLHFVICVKQNTPIHFWRKSVQTEERGAHRITWDMCHSSAGNVYLG